MGDNSILNLCLFLTFVSFLSTCFHGPCFSYEVRRGGGGGSPYNSVAVSSFSYPKTQLRPYDWRYIKVDLPPWFSSMSVSLESDVDLDPGKIENIPSSKLPIICLREGSPPLPDVYNISLAGLVLEAISNAPFADIRGLQNAELCYPMQQNMSVIVTNEQISPGVWYWGLFNGIGPTRTQSKMINRGPVYSFSGNISVEGCATPSMWGQYCNQTVDLLSCADNYNLSENLSDTKLFNQTAENVIFCRNSNGNSCHGGLEPKIYALDVMGIAEQLTIVAANVKLNETASSNGTWNASGIALMCYARHGAIPQATLHDYSANISEEPLVISSPKVGRWYFAVHMNVKACYILDWLVFECPEGKAGFNCSWERYMLQNAKRENRKQRWRRQNGPDPPSRIIASCLHTRTVTVLRTNPYFEADYVPISEKISSDSANFPLEPLLSNSSIEGKLEVTWTYFLLDIPSGAAGGSLKLVLLECVFHILLMFFIFSYCSCDRDHGGFDCSIEIVSHKGHIWQSIALIASNVAALLPAYWSLHQKAYAEWVLFMCSGVSSGLYHACDVGTWCPLSFHVLQVSVIGTVVSVFQFMDFWLSFMAVVSTFVYLADIDEASKRTIHTIVAIITALMAAARPTSSTNITLVMAIGALGLLTGWLIEFCTKNRSLPFTTEFRLNVLYGWQAVKGWLHNLVKTLLKRFRWGFVVAGFIALAMAVISWKLETSESYWIWHSMWHVSIYTSSFLFLYSKVDAVVDGESGGPPDGNYELTRQDSFSRG
ncbi:hypothetical protein RHGRI_019062 [Rhododendron griersonianum]|uniref:Transmembrane protein n=1 Tax=Rhododendron griersonianum TaxID=479676 RepID=A0AAV6JFD0_9ERIC|nr:hypothetical protein RHGRI_019062 [Rhododendron griersonianum]